MAVNGRDQGPWNNDSPDEHDVPGDPGTGERIALLVVRLIAFPFLVIGLIFWAIILGGAVLVRSLAELFGPVRVPRILEDVRKTPDIPLKN